MARSRIAPALSADHPQSAQLGLFDTMSSGPPAGNENTPQRRPRARQACERIVALDDLPSYPVEAVAAVRQNMLLLPKAQLWFTYKDIRFFFGVSRATVARRLREGLVPGIRMAGASVVEEAAVRRFDRPQLEWLLLALRHRKRELTPDINGP